MRRDYIIANCKRVREKGIFSQFHLSILSNLIILIVSCCWLSSSSLHHFSDFSFPLLSLLFVSKQTHLVTFSLLMSWCLSVSHTSSPVDTNRHTHICESSSSPSSSHFCRHHHHTLAICDGRERVDYVSKKYERASWLSCVWVSFLSLLSILCCANFRLFSLSSCWKREREFLVVVVKVCLVCELCVRVSF